MMMINETKNYLSHLKSSSGLSNAELIEMIDEYNKCLTRDNTDDATEWGFVYLPYKKVGILGNFSKILDIVYITLVENKYVFCCNTETTMIEKYNTLMTNGFIEKDDDTRYNDLVKLECFLFMKRIITNKCLKFIQKGVEINTMMVYEKLCNRFNIVDDNYIWCLGICNNSNYRPPNKSIFKTKVSLSTKIFN